MAPADEPGDATKITNAVGILETKMATIEKVLDEVKRILLNGFSHRLNEASTKVAVLEKGVAEAERKLDSGKRRMEGLTQEINGIGTIVALIRADRKEETRRTIARTGAYTSIVTALVVLAVPWFFKVVVAWLKSSP